MSPQLIRERMVTARKTHPCATCNRPAAQPGEKYHRATYVYDGRVYDWVQCLPCRDVSGEVFAWSVNADDAGVGPDEYAEWASEHAEHGTPDQQVMAKDYLERLE